MHAVEEYKVSDIEMEELLKLLLKVPKENEWLEFKHNNDNPNMIGEYISALSNSAALCNKEYAYLVYGIDDNTKSVIGTEFDFNNAKKGNEPLYNWLYRKLKPQIDFDVFNIEYCDKKVLIFQISKAKLYPVEFDNIAYIRVGEQKRKLCDYKEKEKKLWNILSNISFEEEVALSNLNVLDIKNLLEFDIYYKLLKLPIPDSFEKVIDDLNRRRIFKACVWKISYNKFGCNIIF